MYDEVKDVPIMESTTTCWKPQFTLRTQGKKDTTKTNTDAPRMRNTVIHGNYRLAF